MNLNFGAKKQRSIDTKVLKKNTISEAKTMEFGRKTMMLWTSTSRWHISNRKVALICLKLNYGEKKTTTEMKIFKKMPFWRPKQWNLAEKRWTSYRVQSVDPFPIEKLHQFVRIWILSQKKENWALKRKFSKKMPFRRQKRWNLAEKWWISYAVMAVDPFAFKKLNKFAWI